MAKEFKISTYLKTLFRDLTHPNSLLNIDYNDKIIKEGEQAESMLMAGAGDDNKDDSDLENEYGGIPGTMIMPHKRLLGWQHNIVFSVTDADTIAWGTGTITLVDNTTYSIVAGNTGDMSAETFIYLDLAISKTILQTTTTIADSVGANKILIAIAENATDEAEFIVFGSANANIDGRKIRANSITANEIAANTITAGEIFAGAITTTELNFTPLVSTGTTADIIATISASSEGGGTLRISANKIHITGSVTFAAGWASQANAESDIDGSGINNDSGWTDDAAADAAQNAANAAQTDANINNALLDDIAADNKITPIEKLTIKPLWDAIVAEKSDIDTQADTYSVSKTAYGTAYTNLNNYLNTTLTVFANMATTTNITRADWDGFWEAYFNAKIEILQAIADAIQSNVDSAQSTADSAQADANTAQTTAEARAKVFRQNTAPSSGMVAGDVWIKTNDGDRPYNYNGSDWIETLTIIDGGKITTGTIDASVVTVINLDAASITTGEIVIGRTQAKNTNPLADQTSVNNQGVAWLNEAVGSVIPVANTAAKATDPNADETALNTAADTAKVQGSTIMIGGYIATAFLTASNIVTGTLTAILMQTSLSANTGIKMSGGIGGMDVYGQTIDFYEGSTKYGYIGTYGGYFQIESVSNRNIKITTNAGSVYFALNAGSGIAPLNSGQGTCGLSSQYWANVFTNNLTLATGKSFNVVTGRITASADFVANGSLHATGNVYTGGISGAAGSVNCATINTTLLHLNHGSINPASHGEIRNYAVGATDQFRGIPGDGSWMGSFDMSAE